MFCTKCGAEIIEGTKFCTRCGAPVARPGPAPAPDSASPATPAAPAAPAARASAPAAAPAPAANRAGSAAAAPAGKAGGKKPLVLGAAVLAVVVIAALVFFLKGAGGGLGSPEKAFDAFMGGYASGDFDLMLKAYPDFRIDYSGGKDSLKETLAQNFEYEFGSYVDDYTFTYKATGHTTLSETDRQDVEDGINSTFGTDVKITEAATVDYTITTRYKADGTEQTSSFTGGYAVRYKGKWYYFNVF